MDDFEKYIKYKHKYLHIKNQIGGHTKKFSIEDEIFFWARQMMEHALFLYLGLEDDKNKLKNEALELNKEWENFLNDKFPFIKINEIPEKVFLTQDDESKIHIKGSLDMVNNLIGKTIKFKTNVDNMLKSGKWIGWIYPSLIQHMLDEANYFKKKINGDEYTIDNEIEFINHHHEGELSVTAQLIDPDPEQQKIIDKVKSYVKDLSDLQHDPSNIRYLSIKKELFKNLNPTERTNMLMISLIFSRELTNFAKETGEKIKNNKLKSIISPILANHIYREFVRFTETLRYLENT